MYSELGHGGRALPLILTASRAPSEPEGKPCDSLKHGPRVFRKAASSSAILITAFKREAVHIIPQGRASWVSKVDPIAHVQFINEQFGLTI